jgi:hypothetical protein
MAQYHFYIDEKVTVWNRRKYRVTARSKAKAVEIMKQEFNDPKYELDHDSEILWDTESVVNKEDNNGVPTRELIDRNNGKDDTILTN